MKETDPKKLRDYGYGAPPETVGTPIWVKAKPINGLEPLCPNCGAWLCEVRVQVENPVLRGGKGTGKYLGCPACPWASPMMTTATGGG